MRSLLIAWVANSSTGILFGNVVQQFDEYPNIMDLESIVMEHNEGVEGVTILSITEMNDKDFNRFTR